MRIGWPERRIRSWLEHALDTVPFQHEMIDEWRNNFKGMTWFDPRTNLNITGAVDDIWQDRATNKLMVVDYKATAKNGEVTLDVTPDENGRSATSGRWKSTSGSCASRALMSRIVASSSTPMVAMAKGSTRRSSSMFRSCPISATATGSNRSCSTSKPA